jgi:dihydrofolate reductase
MGADGWLKFYDAAAMEHLGFNFTDICSIAPGRTYEWTRTEFPFLKKCIWVVYDSTERYGDKWDLDGEDDGVYQKKSIIQALKQCKICEHEVWT